jgi:hypothetical protein
VVRPTGWPTLLLLALVTTSAARAQSQSTDPLRPLAILIGTWDVDDVYQPLSGAEIREAGVRTCVYTLLDRYVECVTRARSASGREREYRWLINYNRETHRYDIVGIFSNYTGKVHHTVRIDSTGTVWNIRTPSSFTDDGIEQWSWAQLVFEGRDRAVWTAYRNLETNAPTEWSVSTRETWVRRPSAR